MENFKNVLKKAVFIPGWLMIFLSVFSAAALVTVFVKGWQHSPVSYIVYPVSAYCLTVVVAFLIKGFPARYKSAKQRVYDNPLGNRYMTDNTFKTLVSLHISLGFNLLYSAFKLVTGIYYSSVLWISIAVYYIILSVIRFLILRYMRSGESGQDMISEYKRCRLCGSLMLALNLTLTTVVTYLSVSDDIEPYPLSIILISATYTFYRVTVSVIDIAKYRKRERPVVRTSKAIRLAAALASLLSLEATMLVTFGESADFRKWMTTITGACVCIIVACISLYIIIRSHIHIKQYKMNT